MLCSLVVLAQSMFLDLQIVDEARKCFNFFVDHQCRLQLLSLLLLSLLIPSV
jgi:hypothetical protein